MSNIAVETNPTSGQPKSKMPARTISTRFGSSGQSQLNKILAFALVIFVSLAPIPLGSNGPVFWAMSGLILATIAIAYCIFLQRQRAAFRHGCSRLFPLLLPYFLLLSFIFVQVLPFGDWINPVQIPIAESFISNSTMSLTPGMSILSLIQQATYGLLFFLMLQVSHNADRAYMIIRSFFWVITAYATYALFALTQLGDPVLFIEKWAYLGSATGTFVNRNSFATFLSFGLVIGSVSATISFLPQNEHVAKRGDISSGVFYALGTIVVLAALIASQSRVGFAAGMIGTMVAIALVLWSKAKTLLWPALLLGSVSASILLFLYGGGLLERIGSIETSTEVRFALYSQINDMIGVRPWTGYGAGSFELAFPLFHRLPVSPDFVWDKAHSTYLSLWSELGIVFGSIPILLVLLIGRITWRIFRTTKVRWTNAAISLGVITTAALHSLVDFSLEIHAIALLFTAILAVGMAGPEKSR